MAKKIILILVIVVLLGGAGWYFFMRKIPEGGACKATKNCEAGLKCANRLCSSGNKGASCEEGADCETDFCVSKQCTEGKRGDICSSKTDCLTQYCVNGKCTEGKKDDACITYQDCEGGLFCKKGVCTEPPSYAQYFNKIIISKIKVGSPPGPNNIPIPTTTFKTTDGLEIDLLGVKPTTTGEFYYEIVDSITGEVLFPGVNNKQKLDGRDRGTGSDLPKVPGEYDLNIYYNDEMIYTTSIKISE